MDRAVQTVEPPPPNKVSRSPKPRSAPAAPLDLAPEIALAPHSGLQVWLDRVLHDRRFYWACSIALHIVLLTWLFLFTGLWRRGSGVGTANALEASVTETEGKFDDTDWSEVTEELALSSTSELSASSSDVPNTAAPLGDLSEQLGQSLGSQNIDPAQMLAQSLGTGGTGTGADVAEGAAGGGYAGSGVEFGQVRANGQKIVFVIDRSLSMRQNYAIEAAKNELVKSLTGLHVSQEFQVIFYSTDVMTPLGWKRDPLLPATPRNIEKAVAMVKTIAPDGGTNHGIALQKAVEAKPDIIFMLTDADVDDPNQERAMITRITRLCQNSNRQNKIQIHVIQFTHHEEGDVVDLTIKELADRNNGQHKLFYTDKFGQTFR